MQNKKYKYIIVGAGIAGLSAIKGIREIDKQGEILLLSNEHRLPYKRTKVNKHIAVGFETNDFALKPKAWFSAQKVDLVWEALNTVKNSERIIVTDKQKYSYEKLLLCMGAQSNTPHIEGLSKIPYHFVHYAHEVETIIEYKANSDHYLIIGGGIEGLETADQLLQANKQVSLIQRSKNPLQSLFPKPICSSIRKAIDQSAMNYIEGDQVKSLSKNNNHYLAKTNSKEIAFDQLIICAGSKPNLNSLSGSTLKIGKGIKVNALLQTNDKDIYAAGDIAEHDHGWVTGLWHPAEYQGLAAGKNMAGLNEIYQAVPYRLKSEFLGHFLFSANFNRTNNPAFEAFAESKGQIHREFYIKDHKIHGIAMQNDKSRAKIYQKAIAEQWTMEAVRKNIPLT